MDCGQKKNQNPTNKKLNDMGTNFTSSHNENGPV